MRRALAIVCILLCAGCGTVHTIQPEAGPYAHVDAPVLPEASLDGPIVERFRIAGWSTFTYRSAALAAAGSHDGYAAASASSSAFGTSVAYEHFKSEAVEDFLRKLLEDTGTVTRIFPGADWEIRGSGGSSSLRCPACVVWVNLATVTLISFVGVPLYGVREASVELRLYRDHEFVQSYVGYGRCGVFGTIYYLFWNGITYANRGGTLGACSTAAAVADAVRKLQDNPPTLAVAPMD